MTRFLKGRVAKLETLNRPPEPAMNCVVLFDPTTDRILSPLPKHRKIMLVPQWPSDDEWESAAIEQQERLINSAA